MNKSVAVLLLVLFSSMIASAAIGYEIGHKNLLIKSPVVPSSDSLEYQLAAFARKVIGNPPISAVARACVWFRPGVEIGVLGPSGQDWACIDFTSGEVSKHPNAEE